MWNSHLARALMPVAITPPSSGQVPPVIVPPEFRNGPVSIVPVHTAQFGGIVQGLENTVNSVGNSIAGAAGKVGNPGISNFNATAFQNNPNSGYNAGAFQGGWNNASNPFSTQNMAAGAGAAGSATSAGYNQAQGGFGQVEAGQQGLAQSLQGEANGTAPSVAQSQLAQNTQTNIANQFAAAASGANGQNPGMAQYNAANIGANANQQAAGQAATAGIQEREGAQSLLGSTLGQEGSTFNQQGQSGQNQQQLQNQMVQYYTSQGMSQEQAQLQASIAQQQMLSGNYNAAQSTNAGVAMNNANNSQKNVGGILSGLGSLGASGASSMASLAPMLMAAAKGGVVPGPNMGQDSHPYMLDGGEVIVPPSNPIYSAARHAVAHAIALQVGAVPSGRSGTGGLRDVLSGSRPGQMPSTPQPVA